jgi:uncharacterized protein YkwD
MSFRSAISAESRRLLGAVLVAATVMTGVVAAGGTAEAATAAETTAANAVLSMMNAERAAHRLPALRMSTALISSAHRHNLWMAQANTLSHQLPGEPYFGTRISQAGVQWHAAAENIGWTTNRTTSGADGLEAAMYNETPPNDGHRRNILSTAVHYVGVDVYIDARTGKLWLTEDFADVSGVVAPTAAQIAKHNPIGVLDSATVLPGHQVRLVGWAVDPDNKSVPLLIAVYYDGKYAGRHQASVARPDVAARYHAGPTLGYNIVLTLPAGRHTIYTYAINIGTGNASPRLGYRTRLV